MRWLLLLSPLAIVGCESNVDKGEGKFDDTAAPSDEPTLQLTLDPSSGTAGEDVAYTLVVVVGSEQTPVEADSLSSDLEANLSYDADSLAPTVAGGHTLTATATWEGESLSTWALLEVGAGPAAELSLSLSESFFMAGGSVTYTVTAADAYGNAVDTSAATVAADSADVSVSGGVITGVIPGAYAATASLDGASDTEYFQITTGSPAAIDLTLSDTDLELGDSTTAEVVVTDEYGNLIEDLYTLSVEGGTVEIDGDTITFPEEGEFTVIATVEGTALLDSEGPLLVDSTGPDLVVTEPERGDWSEGLSGKVNGSVSDQWSGVGELTVNGESVTIGDDGAFSTDATWDFGLNVVETSATDGDGNTTTDTRAVLAGDFLSYGEGAPSAMLVRINEGEGGLDEIELLGEGLVAATDLDALIPYPAYSYYEEECIDYWFDEVCFDWYSVNLYITSPRISSTDMVLDPLSSGQLQASFIVYGPSLNWSASGDVVGIGYSGSGTITADSITVTLLLTPYVSGGDIGVTVNSVSVSSSGFDFDFDSWIYDVLDYVGVDIDGMIQDYMEGAIEDVVYGEVPGLMAETFQDLEIGYTFAVEDNSYSFVAVPDAVAVDGTGITLGLETSVSTSAWTSAYTGLGSLYYGYSQPAWTSGGGTSMGVSADFLNQVFLAMWGGGLMDMSLTDEDLGLDVADLALVLPELTDLTVETEALLPPVVVPGDGEDLLDLQVGDLLVNVYNGPAESGYEYMQVYVSAEAGLNLSATSSATLSAEIGDTEVWFDVVYPDAGSSEAAATEALLGMLVPLLLPELTGALGEIEIPEIEGFTLTDITVTQDGAERGYTVLSGDLYGG